MVKSHENVLKYLIKKEKDSKTNKLYVSKNDCENMKVDERTVVKALYYLQESNYITINKISPHDDLSISCLISLKESALDYIENKGKNKTRIVWEVVRFIIPVIISIIALIIAA